MNFKEIHLGKLIVRRVEELEIEMPRICNFLKSSEEEVLKMYKSRSLDTQVLLRWSKLLEYDFFRIYSQHIILYAPMGNSKGNLTSKNETNLPQFRKNIYTKEVIDFILELVKSGEKTKRQVIEDYGIPKTTLYKWLTKY